MPVRSSMADLIAEVRLKIADPSGGSQFFSDQQVQDHLDSTRLDLQYEALDPRPTLAPSAITWTDYYSRYGYWEADATLIWGNYTTLTPDVSDFIVGHWTFNAGQYPPVFIKGKTYDVWRTSADLLEMWAASFAAAYDFTADGQTFHRAQILKARLDLACQYRRKARSRTVVVARGDTQSGNDIRRQAQIGPISAGVPFITGE